MHRLGVKHQLRRYLTKSRAILATIVRQELIIRQSIRLAHEGTIQMVIGHMFVQRLFASIMQPKISWTECNTNVQFHDWKHF